jgi:acetyl-CoA C-acetyltransferase
MTEPVILCAVRTPIGRFQGDLSSLAAAELGGMAVRAAVSRAGIARERVDEVIFGNVLSAGVGQAPARQAALRGGLPDTVAALTVNKVCGSGLKAVQLAAQAVATGDAEIVIAGGMESMSRAPYLVAREQRDDGGRVFVDSMLHEGLQCALSGRSMGQIAETLAAADGFTRSELDDYALESHRRAVAAQDRGEFNDELAAVVLGDGRIVNQDEGPRRDTSLERLSQLRPVFDEGGRVTAGNASMISDGAAALVVTSARRAAADGVRPLAKVRSFVTVGGPPTDLFVAPAAAVRAAVRKAGLALSDVDLFEINEAFAVQMLACLRRLELSPDRVNVRGGAIALGHPLGASGARVAVTLLHALRQRDARIGVAALCLGGGNAIAGVFERVE